MSYRKTLALAFLAVALSSCGGKLKKDQIDINAEQQNQEQQSQMAQNFDAVNSEADAAQMNQEAQAQVDAVEVADRVFFDLNASSLSDDAQKILSTQSDWLKSDPSIRVTIEGHCDERGTREYNLALGERRANAAKQYLLNHGVDGSRIKTISYGKERPAFVGSTEEVWSKNRRAVTVVNE